MSFLSFSSEHYALKQSCIFSNQLNHVIYQVEKSSEVMWSYPVPKLGEGGSCSLFGELEDKPFSLTRIFSRSESSLLSKLAKIVDYVVQSTEVEWFGIYLVKEVAGIQQLVKVAYHGAPSRALFPITKEFSLISNNVEVAKSQQGRIINNIKAYVDQGGQYYNCDPQVNAELCLPLIDNDGNTLGIIDAEAFECDFFSEQIQSLFATVCLELQQLLIQSKMN